MANKSEDPWSVRNISVQSRNIARRSARKEGKKLGEWLEQAIANEAENSNSQDKISHLIKNAGELKKNGLNISYLEEEIKEILLLQSRQIKQEIRD